jgi:hypothetical protein
LKIPILFNNKKYKNQNGHKTTVVLMVCQRLSFRANRRVKKYTSPFQDNRPRETTRYKILSICPKTLSVLGGGKTKYNMLVKKNQIIVGR